MFSLLFSDQAWFQYWKNSGGFAKFWRYYRI